MKTITSLMVVAFAEVAMATIPTITGVMAQQRYPWNGKVDISYTITGDIVNAVNQKALVPFLQVLAIDNNTTNIATAVSGDLSFTEGEHNIVWDMDAEGLSIKSTNVILKISCETRSAKYCVIDLSSGSNAQNYPVSYMTTPPDNGFNADEYKTTKLVLRRIEAGSFSMGGQYDVTITKPFFIGIFEMTQKQYSLVMGSNPSQYKGNMRPVDSVSYNTIRGDDSGRNWPSNSDVDQSSFVGKLRKRTNVNIDLPTEAQWEYACRAGTTSKYNNGGNTEDDLKRVGRYVGNVSDGKGGYSSNQTTVGSYNANAWELYDMHGNVSERCLNWYNSSLAEGMGNGIDPKGPSSSSIGRVVRGGNCYEYASYCTSSYREGKLASNADYSIGFRVSCSLSSEPETICFGERGSVAIDLSTGTRVANLIERIHYSSLWVDGAAPDDVVVMEINGETFKSVMGRGHMVWYPSSNGTYVVTHRVKSGNKQIGETQMVTFIVDRLGLLATQTTEIPVPYAWLRQCYVNIPDDYDAYEATSKATALNGHKVWECYVVGLDPMIPTDNFKITSFRLTTDGTPDLEHIVFYPPQSRWNVLGAQPVIKGVAALGSDWQTVTDENKAALRFFKVEVSMP